MQLNGAQRRRLWIIAPLLLSIIPWAAHSADTSAPKPAWPLWDGRESVAEYAQHVNLPPTKTLDLGNNVKLELVLIPAGKFIMGTPKPTPVDENGFHEKIVIGQAFLAAGVCALLVMLSVIVIRAIRLRRRPQYSLARFIVMMFVLSVGVLGGEHWWYSNKMLEKAKVEYQAELVRNKDHKVDEQPHKVIISAPFYFGKFTVTQQQYLQVIGTNPSKFYSVTPEQFQQVTGAYLSNFMIKDNPVETVSYEEAQEFCKLLSDMLKLVIRLPTEAEWEYSCRAGTNTKYYSGDTEDDLKRVAWYDANSGYKTHPVGQKEPNKFGLYDMHGNVEQWCQDWWYGDYPANEVVDPQGSTTVFARVLRGGSFDYFARNCRSACRDQCWPDARMYRFGFRVVVPAPGTP